MKKKMMLCLIPLLLLTSCGYDTVLDLGIGDGTKEDAAVRLCMKFNDTWEPNKEAIYVNYGHEKNADLQERYNLSISKNDPTFSNNIELKTIYSFTKDLLEPKEVVENGFEFTYQGDFAPITFESFDFLDKTENGETKNFYFVFSHDNSDFKNITTFTASKIEYSYDGNKVVVNK